MKDIISGILTIMTLPLIFGSFALIYYVINEQEHRHKIELEKAKQGVFDKHEQDNVKSRFEKILITVVILAIVLLAFYAFHIPSDFLKYVMQILGL
mgnify:CR=1 FL=1